MRKKQNDYATGRVTKPTRFVCPFCGNVAWQSPIFITKPFCENCGIYMDEEETNNLDKESNNDKTHTKS